MHVRSLAIAIVLAGVLGTAACGGPIRNDELRRGVQTLSATASEGRLVALDVVEDRTKTTFVRVETRDLADEATHEAEKLNDAQARPGNKVYKAKAVKLAQNVASALGDLQVSPSNRDLARRVERQLDALSKQANALVDAL